MTRYVFGIQNQTVCIKYNLGLKLIVTFSESECFSREVLVLLAKVRVNVASDCVAAGDVIDELIDSIHLLLTGKLNISVIGGGALEY